MYIINYGKGDPKNLETLSKKKKSLSVFSCFDWTVPGTPELICESAALAKIPCYYFPKPISFFKLKSNQRGNLKGGFHHVSLSILATRLGKLRGLSQIQNSWVIRQLEKAYSKNDYKDSTLIYNNLESIVGILPRLKKMYKRIMYLCLDYSDLGEDFMANTRHADKILVVPKSMVERIEKIYPNKTLEFPQLTSIYSPQSKKSERVENLLKLIPPPRIIYTGNFNKRIDDNLYRTVTETMKDCSFLSFHEKPFQKVGNVFHLPWLEKEEIFSMLEECSVGFMPYDLKVDHNLHCIPLKLFEYFQLGMPLVSTDLVNIQYLKPLLSTGKNSEELIAGLRESLLEPADSSLRDKRKAVGKEHSTSNQVNLIRDILNDA